ncbi:hypothetical protein, partial [Lacticaseibacillus rhamnosus]
CAGERVMKKREPARNALKRVITIRIRRYLKWIKMATEIFKSKYSLLTNYLERTGSVSVSLIDCYYLGVGIMTMTKTLSLLLAVT